MDLCESQIEQPNQHRDDSGEAAGTRGAVLPAGFGGLCVRCRHRDLSSAGKSPALG